MHAQFIWIKFSIRSLLDLMHLVFIYSYMQCVPPLGGRNILCSSPKLINYDDWSELIECSVKCGIQKKKKESEREKSVPRCITINHLSISCCCCNFLLFRVAMLFKLVRAHWFIFVILITVICFYYIFFYAQKSAYYINWKRVKETYRIYTKCTFIL